MISILICQNQVPAQLTTWGGRTVTVTGSEPASLVARGPAVAAQGGGDIKTQLLACPFDVKDMQKKMHGKAITSRLLSSAGRNSRNQIKYPAE